MIDKTIKLTGEYPSDFKPSVPVQEVQQFFEAHNFFDGRMIGGSKSHYHKEHPDDLIVFNANVLMPGYGKVWYGDLNLTEDYLVLREIAQNLNTDLYVLWESDGRFGLEMKPLNELFDKAVWNTSEDNPTKEWYKNKMEIK
jgi:hypothetical protein